MNENCGDLDQDVFSIVAPVHGADGAVVAALSTAGRPPITTKVSCSSIAASVSNKPDKSLIVWAGSPEWVLSADQMESAVPVDPPPRMRAAWYQRTGPAHEVLQVGEMVMPRPGPEQVLVAVAISGINPHDTKKRSGWTGEPLAASRIVPHADRAGIIAAVGSGVPQEQVGSRVWFFRADIVHPGSGSAADYALVPALHAVNLPDDVPFEIGACLGVPGLTAYAAVFTDGPVEGQGILVQGGAGAVAGYAIQLARAAGARVIATVSSPEKAAVATAFGAESVVNYRTENVVQFVLDATGGSGVHRVIEVDFGSNVDVDAAVLRPHGVIASYSSSRIREPKLPYYALAKKDSVIRFIQAMRLSRELQNKGAAHLAALIEEGRLQHPDRHIFPLEHIAEAHEMVESGQMIGKVVIAMRNTGNLSPS